MCGFGWAGWQPQTLLGLADRDVCPACLVGVRSMPSSRSRVGTDPLVVGFHQINGRDRGHAWDTGGGHGILESEAELHAFSAELRVVSRVFRTFDLG